MKELTGFSFQDQIDENRKIHKGIGKAQISGAIHHWFVKRFCRGNCSYTSLIPAIEQGKIVCNRSKRFDVIETRITTFGDVYRVICDNGGGMFVETTTKWFKE